MLRTIFFIGFVLFAANAQTQQQNITQNSMKLSACHSLSGYYSISQKKVIWDIMMPLQPQSQRLTFDKMHALAIEHCLPLITMDQTQKFFVEDPEFDASKMFYIFEGFDYRAAAANPEQLTQNQEHLIKVIKKIDEQTIQRKAELIKQTQVNNTQTEKDQQAQETQNNIKIVNCIIISRHYISYKREGLPEIFMPLQHEQQPSFKKILAATIEHCFYMITMDQALKIQSLFWRNYRFYLSKMHYIFLSFDYRAATANPEQLTQHQEHLIQAIKKVDEQIKGKLKQREGGKNQGEEL